MPVGAYAPNSYIANGVTTVFPYGFRILDAAHLVVTVAGVVQVAGFTVSGVGVSTGGNVTFAVAPINLASVVLSRAVPYSRTTDYQANGDLRENTLDDDQDAQTMQTQQLAELTGRMPALAIPVGAVGLPLAFPPPGAGQYLRWNGGGTALEAVDIAVNGSIGIPVSINQGGTNATTAAAARTNLGLGSMAVEANPITTKGDLLVRTSTVLARLGVGTDGQILKADAASSAGVKWATSQPDGRGQTVLSGPVDNSGFAAFGGATGSAVVTASGTLIMSASSGAVEFTGSIVNPQWSGLSVNGTMYLVCDVLADGSCSPIGATVLPCIYNWGGDITSGPYIASGQHTFNIADRKMYVGNGASALQVNRVFVGEVTVAGNVVTAITWYALRGRYASPNYGWALSTLYTNSHNLGVKPMHQRTVIVNTTPEYGWLAGDEVDNFFESNPAGTTGWTIGVDAKAMNLSTGNTTMQIMNRTTPGAAAAATLANWKLKTYLDRGW